MKNSKFLRFVILTAATVSISIESCKKSSTSAPAAPKGCNDPEAIDYSASAKGSICTYPADKLPGVWSVVEKVIGTTDSIMYHATITKVDNKSINIKHNSDYPSTVPPYHKDNMTLQIDWAAKTFVPNRGITGDIVNVNSKCTVSYTDSLSIVYQIKQTYTR